MAGSEAVVSVVVVQYDVRTDDVGCCGCDHKAVLGLGMVLRFDMALGDFSRDYNFPPKKTSCRETLFA